jgi:hypothetical protein
MPGRHTQKPSKHCPASEFITMPLQSSSCVHTGALASCGCGAGGCGVGPPLVPPLDPPLEPPLDPASELAGTVDVAPPHAAKIKKKKIRDLMPERKHVV